MRIIFAGTPEFAAIALQAIHTAGFEIPLVLTQPDRPAGRGMQLHASAVKQFALQHGIAVAQPTSLRLDGKYPEIAQEAHDLLRNTQHDVMVVAAYGLILPRSTLSIPPLGCINIHGSLLPRWRGAAPIHRAIESGDRETGITIMQMEEGLDTGPMLSMQSIAIATDDSTGSLHDKLAQLGGEMIVQTLRALEEVQASIQTTVQPEQGVTYAAKISKEEAALDFNLAADVLARKIRAFNPFPGAHANMNGSVIKIWRAEAVKPSSGTETRPAGRVIAANAHEGVVVACGEQCLRLTELQKPGGKRLPVAEFLKGFVIEVGSQFSR
ncbi:methionyl-tRNA formyltransferase [Undibacterium sp. RTI2.1]|uniref:methionyl-tRNA formyltransferase n=1 Tax=unclassified Undibacterium TaxID=2630295 RepID=UPI002AB5B084|nr:MULTISPECIES: methionyl-tRNA formyltransferase [unclassified Undibacterium]MDY7539511.1 methionyl-tRNA formyltransferase [Undibacterium sp. 5I1]MEB0030185.1 methionyl-tRNA formyltransferase [Undibacterium sp. RTI2.1]MEB0116713.1 methionyl-tRNA formyltransferase [Undibacterium sp. RTI2.2]MEB0232514.1 methionyl-tRNA formyltransferase [Undibacterium sp. 10I3]MEB0259683.1 methionyl-tRNA formyltransferase [Undibacterium sp. 5I1]